MLMKVMRTRKAELWRAGLFLVVVLLIQGRVTGDCNSTAFNLSTFSFETISTVSHSWIDGGGYIRMAPSEPVDPSNTSTSSIGPENNPFGSGQALYKTPASLLDPVTNASASFSTFFSFSLISQRQVLPPAEGMAFIIVPDGSVLSATASGGPSLVDPYCNIWSNSTLNMFAVQLKKRDTYGPASPPLADSTYLEDGATNFAWIDYDGLTMQLQVRVSNSADDVQVPARVQLLPTTTYNLSGVFLQTMYIGFSSRVKLTIRSWSFSSTCSPLPAAVPIHPPPVNPPTQLPIDPKPERGPTNFTTPSFTWSGKAASKHGFFVGHLRLLIYIGAGCGCALIGCVLLALIGRSLWRRAHNGGLRSVPDRDIPYHGPQIFTYRTLSEATNGFDERALLGRGGFGSVYKGIVAENESSTLIAVKRIESKNDAQRERQFIAEVASIGRLRHHNLVQLLGWCHEKGELLLVYEYMPNGSLDRLLFGTQERVLPWESRYNIVSGVAGALAYLHCEWEKQVVHRDVKASNVLLDSDFNARLGDFGLARLIEHNKNPESTSVAGTLGYLAPEIRVTGKATDKTDVFSFGALALEVACGRRPIERRLAADEVVLVDWVWHLHSKGEMMNALDSRLGRDHYSMHQAASFLSIGLLCSHPDPAARPSMRQVVGMLKGELRCPPVPTSKPLAPFSSRHPNPHNPPTSRSMVAAAAAPSKPSRASSRIFSRVSDCSAV